MYKYFQSFPWDPRNPEHNNFPWNPYGPGSPYLMGLNLFRNMDPFSTLNNFNYDPFNSFENFHRRVRRFVSPPFPRAPYLC